MKELTSLFYKKISLIILLIFLVNPFTLYMLTDDVLLTFIIFTASLFLGVITYFKQKNKVLFNLIFFINILLFITVYSELIFRNNFSYLKINNLYEKRNNYYFNKPNLNIVLEDNEYQTIYKTNNKGYRIGHLKNKQTNIDWLFIGDSYTQGAQVNYEELFTSILDKKHVNTSVVNAGVSGFGLIEESNYLVSEGVYLKPKKVFLTLCVLNDFNSFDINNYNLLDLLMEKSYLARYILYNHRFENKKDLPLKRWVEPFFENEQDNINSNILYTKVSEVKLIKLSKLEIYLQRIKEVTNTINAKLYVILIPTKEQVYTKFYKEVITNYQIDSNLIDLERSSKILAKLSDSIDFTLIDPLKKFRIDNRMLYFDIDEHLNVAGHERLYEIINETLINE